jgi:NADH:ubiquinone reductase (H+-translocating)
MKQQMATWPHVVIVGGGFGGLTAARSLAHAPVRVTIIDRNNYHLFQPLLYQVATAELSPADISAPIRSIVRRQRQIEVLMAEVVGVDVTQQEVMLITAEAEQRRGVHYDYLILATGASENYFGHDDWRFAAPGLKSIADATALRRKILSAFEAAELAPDSAENQALLTFVLVGGGPTGVEMAGAIAELTRKAMAHEFRHINPATARILLVEAAPRILNTFPESLARQAQRKLERSGVEVRTGVAVEAIDETGVTLGGEHISARTVIWAAGVSASPAGRWLGVPTDRAGRVQVRDDLSVPNHPAIFVIGDTAAVQHGQGILPGVAPVAMQQGRYVAERIRRLSAGQEEQRPFHYVNKGNLAVIGRGNAIAEIAGLRLHGFIAWLTWAFVHIFYLIGFRNRMSVMLQWAWSYLTFRNGARLITFAEEMQAVRRPHAAPEPASPHTP